MSTKIKYQNRWAGYTNFMDITNSPANTLAAGSQNCFIEDGAKLEVRGGMDYFGAAGTAGVQTNPYWTLAHRIHSKYDDFVNKQGIKIPLRIWYNGTTAIGDVIQVWLPIYVTGVATANKQWYTITANNQVPTAPLLSTHRYYFAEWFDPALTVLQSELIFTYGATKIGNWSGGFANITAVGVGTLTTDTTWEEKGFIWAPEGTNIIVINGVEHTVTAGFGTATITVTGSLAGVNPDDLAFQNVYFNDTLGGKTTYDVCSSINNQVYYEDWRQRNVFISWNRNQISSIDSTIFNGVGLNDGVYSGTFTGTTESTYNVIISSVSPDINEQIFIPGGGGNLNDAIYDTSGYVGTAGATNVYTVLVLADVSLVFSGTHAFVEGEIVQGGTSNAEGIVVKNLTFTGNTFLGIKMLTTNNFINGETITGLTSTVNAATTQTGFQNWIQYLKNSLIVNINTGFGSTNISPLVSNASITLSDGLTILFANYFGHAVGDSFQLTIREGGIDQFQWSVNGGTLSAPVNITGAAQLLSLGVSITFSNINGHTIGDKWSTTAFPTIIRGWSNFTYTIPSRRPGQGFTITLDSNGWTMKPQEHTMLINAAAGHFYDVELKLSADLLSESVTVTRLKSEPQNKVLFPYLINYIKNQLATISQEKTFDLLGRQKFLELQQMKTISDAVRIDFNTVDWEDADILYVKRKIYFNIPRTTANGQGACIFVYDEYRKYWHPPQIFAKRISLLSFIDGALVGHSYEQNESYELFVGTSDLEIFPIQTKMVFPYDASGNRYYEKSTDAIGFEGYISGTPVINWVVNADVGGCSGVATGVIAPQNTKSGLCIPADRASLGKSSLGYHGLGNDPVEVIPHFYYIKCFPNMIFYQRNIEISCSSLNQRWSLVSLGTSIDASNINNSTITDPN